MDRAAKEAFARLGSAGLSRVLGDLLDQRQLVQLANACGVKYRGMRTQSQNRERLAADIAAHAAKHGAARQAVQRTLRKVAGEAFAEWTALDPQERTRRLGDDAFLAAKGNFGLHLYLLAASPRDEEGERDLDRLLAQGAGTVAPEREARDEARLRRRLNELERKVKHLDAQLQKSRETEKLHKRDLIERKGELAESRMLVERLRAELAAAQSAARPARADQASEAAAELGREVKRLATQQRKLAHALEKQVLERAQGAEEADPVASAIAALRQELAAREERQMAALAAQERKLETLRAELKREPSHGARVARPTRRRDKNAPPRVGVFIDVQNVYYGARRLKGKLDFDALLDAAVDDRRLILAKAYVVETKETDQSQFIQVLEKRAIEVRRKTLNVRMDGSMKGDWDMELALDVLDAAPQLDVVVLVSGDGDFTSLVQRVKAMGPRVEVIAFPRHTAKALVEAADSFKPLDRKFMIYSRRPKPEGDEDGAEAAPEERPGKPAAPAAAPPVPDDRAASAS